MLEEEEGGEQKRQNQWDGLVAKASVTKLDDLSSISKSHMVN